jgi:hypothetical protein
LPPWQGFILPPVPFFGAGFFGGRDIISVSFWPAAGDKAVDSTDNKTDQRQKKKTGYPGPFKKPVGY